MSGDIDPAEVPYVAARKYSVTIAGHETSIRLEPAYWEALTMAARQRDLPVNALIARIDAARITAPDSPNLASAIRLWVLAAVRGTTTSSQAQK